MNKHFLGEKIHGCAAASVRLQKKLTRQAHLEAVEANGGTIVDVIGFIETRFCVTNKNPATRKSV